MMRLALRQPLTFILCIATNYPRRPTSHMYNLLVTAAEDAWNLDAYEYDRSRFLEYTAESVKARLAKLSTV